MMDENATWQAFQNPRVLQGIQRLDTLFGVPCQALYDKIKEGLALISDDLLKRPRTRQSQTAICIFDNVQGLICSLTEELIFSLRIFEHFKRWNAKDLHDQGQLLHLGLTGEDWNARVELDQDAPETPHIDSCRVRDSNYDLRRPIKA